MIRARVLLFSSVATGALAACGGDGGEGSAPAPAAAITVAATATPTPVSTPTPTPTPTPSPTPTPTPLASPTPTPAPSPTPLVSTGTLIIQAGDSIGGGYGGYAAIDHLGFDASVNILNVSFPGETMAHGYYIKDYNEFRWYDPTKTCVILIELGTNDLGNAGSPAADVYANSTTPYVAAAKAAGFYVALITVLPRSYAWSPAQEAERIKYNNLVRANSAGADAIVDWAADPLMGDGVDPSTSPYYADGLHPSVQGQQRLAPIDAGALAPLLGKTPRTPTTRP